MNVSYVSVCGWWLVQQDKSINSINDLQRRGRGDNMRIKDQRSMLIFPVLFASILHRFQP